VDYAALDFSADKPVTACFLKPGSATDEKGKDVRTLICNTDNKYLYQPVPGCQVSISYHLPQMTTGKQYDLFLHSRGYYEHVRSYTGLPDKKLLLTFKKEGAFTEFSKNLYDKINVNMGFVSSVQTHHGNPSN